LGGGRSRLCEGASSIGITVVDMGNCRKTSRISGKPRLTTAGSAAENQFRLEDPGWRVLVI
jgi:hypothetical protein